MFSQSIVVTFLLVFAFPCIFAGPVAWPLAKQRIVPDVIDILPADVVQVSFPSDVLDQLIISLPIQVTYCNGLQVAAGNELTPSQVSKAPCNVSWSADGSSLYTLIMVDPDAPSRDQPSLGEFIHWLVINIKDNDVSTGETITPYLGSMPPKDTGLHRYTFLVFEHSTPVKLHELVEKRLRSGTIADRVSFSTKNFIRQNTLGNPVAANMYVAQFEK